MLQKLNQKARKNPVQYSRVRSSEWIHPPRVATGQTGFSLFLCGGRNQQRKMGKSSLATRDQAITGYDVRLLTCDYRAQRPHSVISLACLNTKGKAACAGRCVRPLFGDY